MSLTQSLILCASDKVTVVLKLLLGHAHAERLGIATIQKYPGLENRHLFGDPQRRHAHTAIGMGHTEPQLLIGQIQSHAVLGTAGTASYMVLGLLLSFILQTPSC